MRFISLEKNKNQISVDAIQRGIGFITEDRKNQGLILSMDILTMSISDRMRKSMQFGSSKEKPAKNSRALSRRVEDLKQ